MKKNLTAGSYSCVRIPVAFSTTSTLPPPLLYLPTFASSKISSTSNSMSSHNLAATSTTVTPSVPYPDTGLSVRDILTHPPTLPSLHELLSFPRVPYLYLSLDRISATPYYYLYTFLPNLSRHLLLTLWFDPSMPASRPGHS